jgi:flagellar biosynthesis protein FliP
MRTTNSQATKRILDNIMKIFLAFIIFASGAVHAQSLAQILQGIQTANNITQITQQQIRAEIDQELKNYVRAQGGDANAQNLSRLYQQQQQQQQQQQATHKP